MQVLTAAQAISTVVSYADKSPEPEEVKAGWLAFGIFIALIVAVAFLGWSLVKQLRKVDRAEEAGLYDPSDRVPPPDIPVETAAPRRADDADGPASRAADTD